MTAENIAGVFDERILVPETTDQWLWIVVLGAFGAFFAAFGIGANDVANAFATSVGAKAITLRQAVAFAAVFEFLGALLLGAHVTKTIRSGIAKVSVLQQYVRWAQLQQHLLDVQTVHTVCSFRFQRKIAPCL